MKSAILFSALVLQSSAALAAPELSCQNAYESLVVSFDEQTGFYLGSLTATCAGCETNPRALKFDKKEFLGRNLVYSGQDRLTVSLDHESPGKGFEAHLMVGSFVNNGDPIDFSCTMN